AKALCGQSFPSFTMQSRLRTAFVCSNLVGDVGVVLHDKRIIGYEWSVRFKAWTCMFSDHQSPTEAHSTHHRRYLTFIIRNGTVLDRLKGSTNRRMKTSLHRTIIVALTTAFVATIATSAAPDVAPTWPGYLFDNGHSSNNKL